LHTGAEIEAAFVEAPHRAFAEDREPTVFELALSTADIQLESSPCD